MTQRIGYLVTPAQRGTPPDYLSGDLLAVSRRSFHGPGSPEKYTSNDRQQQEEEHDEDVEDDQ